MGDSNFRSVLSILHKQPDILAEEVFLKVIKYLFQL